jgi:hypothetical protein
MARTFLSLASTTIHGWSSGMMPATTRVGELNGRQRMADHQNLRSQMIRGDASEKLELCSTFARELENP